MNTNRNETSKVIGYDACLHSALSDCTYEIGAVLFPTKEEAERDALLLAKQNGAEAIDACVRARYEDGRAEIL